MVSSPKLSDPKTDSVILATGSAAIEKQLGFWAHGVIIDNLTNQWLYIKEVYAFIAPYISGRQIPIPGSQKVTVTFMTPVGFSNPTTIPSQVAVVRFTESVVGPAPGVPVAPATVRWNILSRPAAGSVASVTKAAAPGVIHVADLFQFSFVNTSGAAAAIVGVSVIDGPSGGATLLFALNIGCSAVAGTDTLVAGGPNAGQKGTVGNAMTIEFSVGVANYDESVVLIGYDA